MTGPARPRLCFVVESGTDARLVDGLAARASLTVLARTIPGGVAISRTPTLNADIRLGPPGRAAFAAFVVRQLRRQDAQWDHILIQGYGISALVANAVARLSRTPSAMLVCSPIEAYYRCRRANPVAGKRYRAAEYAALVTVARLNGALAARYVVVSEHLADVVRGHRTRASIAVIPVYGVDTRVFAPGTETRAQVRRRLGLPEAGALLFFSSRVAPEKDTPTLLRALALLGRRGRDVRLLHRSGGWNELLALAQTFGVADRVIATDAVHPERELPDSYRAADLCVQASLEEGLGFSPLEALACGTPVVATAVGGLRETVVDGVTGWSVPPRDPEALAGAVTAALDDPGEAARRAMAGRRLVEERYDRSAAFQRLFALIEDAT